MKKEIAEYVDKCWIGVKVKDEHQHPVSELRPLKIVTCKWDSILKNFVIGLPISTTKKNTIWVVVD